MTYEYFQTHREEMNKKILEQGTTNTKRFFTLDGSVYKAGAISEKYKELMGLVASMVLRCDNCISYHIIQCVNAGVTDEEFSEAFDIALIVGGSIVIPHLREAVAFLEDTRNHTDIKDE